MTTSEHIIIYCAAYHVAQTVCMIQTMMKAWCRDVMREQSVMQADASIRIMHAAVTSQVYAQDKKNIVMGSQLGQHTAWVWYDFCVIEWSYLTEVWLLYIFSLIVAIYIYRYNIIIIFKKILPWKDSINQKQFLLTWAMCRMSTPCKLIFNCFNGIWHTINFVL